MKKFTLFNIKWHPIRFIFWIFSTKTIHQVQENALSHCKMQRAGLFLSKKWILGSKRTAISVLTAVEQLGFWLGLQMSAAG